MYNYKVRTLRTEAVLFPHHCTTYTTFSHCRQQAWLQRHTDVTLVLPVIERSPLENCQQVAQGMTMTSCNYDRERHKQPVLLCIRDSIGAGTCASS